MSTTSSNNTEMYYIYIDTKKEFIHPTDYVKIFRILGISKYNVYLCTSKTG